jgi:outer membrane immunogenic protein
MIKLNGFKAAVTAVALIGASTAAQAQDNRAAMWTGAYAGLHVGGDFGKFSTSGGSETVSGVIGGVHAGYNWQAGSMVYGLEGDADISGAKKDYNFGSGVTGTLSNGFLGSLRGRIGFTSGQALFYGTGGLAFASTKFEAKAGGSKASLTDTQTGYVIGLGMEYAISSNMSARIEGLRYGFKDVFKDDIGSGMKYDANVVRAGISYKF